jgi:TolA-binding protein
MRKVASALTQTLAIAGGLLLGTSGSPAWSAPGAPPKVVPVAPVPQVIRVSPPKNTKPNLPSAQPTGAPISPPPKPTAKEKEPSPAPQPSNSVGTDPAPVPLPPTQAPASPASSASLTPLLDFRNEPPPLVNGVPRNQADSLRLTEERKYLGVADALFNKEDWEAASAEYRNFIQVFPKSVEVPAALYRLAECQRKLNNLNAARLLYEKITQLPPPVSFGGVAAYRLAEYEFKEGDYAKAYAHYKRAAQEIPAPPELKQSAQFFAARALHLAGRSVDARAAYKILAEAAEEHPFREASQFHFAVLTKEAGRGDDALPRFETLAAHAKTPAIRLESLVRAALIRVEAADGGASQKTKEKAQADATGSLQAVEKALATPGTEPWHAALHVGALRAYVTLGVPQKIVDTFPLAEPTIEPAQLPEALLLLAGAQRQLKQYQPAAETFERVIRLAPDSPAAATARYDRLACLYNLESPALAQEVDKFLALQPKPAERDKALLMKAESARLKEDYASAAAAYSQVVKSKELHSDRKQEALLRWSECAVLMGDTQQTVAATSQLLSASPASPQAATALFWRAEMQRRSKALAEAEKDYAELVTKHPDSPDRETALLQLVALSGSRNDTKAMAGFYEKILADYPKSSAAAEAHHWVARVAYESGDYPKAATHFSRAKTLNPERYFESDSLAAIYCAYQLNAPDDFWPRVQEYATKGKARVPSDMLRWCARQYLDAKAQAKAEPALQMLVTAEDATETDYLQLAEVRFDLGNFTGAEAALEPYIKRVEHPSLKARGILLRARAELARGAQEIAQKTVEQVLQLQPEGALNGEARILVGDILASKKEWESAAKAFAAVAVVVDDERLTPTALEKAVQAYRSAGKEKEASLQFNKLQSRFPEWVSSRGLK